MKLIKNNVSPTTSTIGNIDDLYVNVETGEVFKCTKITVPKVDLGFVNAYNHHPDAVKYTWTAISGSDTTVPGEYFWDGDLTGKEVIGGRVIKISDEVPDASVYADGLIIEGYINDEWVSVDGHLADKNEHMVVYTGDPEGMTGALGVIFVYSDVPEIGTPGVYLGHMEMNGVTFSVRHVKPADKSEDEPESSSTGDLTVVVEHGRDAYFNLDNVAEVIFVGCWEAYDANGAVIESHYETASISGDTIRGQEEGIESAVGSFAYAPCEGSGGSEALVYYGDHSLSDYIDNGYSVDVRLHVITIPNPIL